MNGIFLIKIIYNKPLIIPLIYYLKKAPAVESKDNAVSVIKLTKENNL